MAIDDLDLTPTIEFDNHGFDFKSLVLLPCDDERKLRRRELNRQSAKKCSANKAKRYSVAKRKLDRLQALFTARPSLKKSFPEAWTILARDG